MAINNVPLGFEPAAGLNYSVITDDSADWPSVANNTYFYDKADGLVHYKNASGTIVKLFESVDGADNFANADLTLTANRTHDLGGFDAKFKNGQFTVEGKDALAASTAFLVTDGDAIPKDVFKITNNGHIAIGDVATGASTRLRIKHNTDAYGDSILACDNGSSEAAFRVRADKYVTMGTATAFASNVPVTMNYDITTGYVLGIENSNLATSSGAGIRLKNGTNESRLSHISTSTIKSQNNKLHLMNHSGNGMSFINYDASGAGGFTFFHGGYTNDTEILEISKDSSENVTFEFSFKDSLNNKNTSGWIKVIADDVTNGSEDSSMEFYAQSAGATPNLHLKLKDSAIVQSLLTSAIADTSLFNNSVSFYTDGTSLKARYKDGTGIVSDLQIGSASDDTFVNKDLIATEARTHDFGTHTLNLYGNDILLGAKSTETGHGGISIGQSAGLSTIKFNSGSTPFIWFRNDSGTFTQYFSSESNRAQIQSTGTNLKLVEGTGDASKSTIELSYGAGGVLVTNNRTDGRIRLDSRGEITFRTGISTFEDRMLIAQNGEVSINNIALNNSSDSFLVKGVNGEIQYREASTVIGGDNFAEKDLTLTANRTHDLGANNLMFNGAGNIGVATTSPNAKLHVNGDVEIENGAIATSNGQGLNLAAKYLANLDIANGVGKYVTIKTNIPFVTDAMMSSLKLTYWAYDSNWEINLGWYTWPIDSILSFYLPNANIVGVAKPGCNFEDIVLSVEAGMVNISIPYNYLQVFGNLSISSLNSANTLGADWYKGWTIVDDLVPTVTSPINVGVSQAQGKNFFDSDLTLSENRTHDLGGFALALNNAGNFGIGTSSPSEQLHVTGNALFESDNAGHFASLKIDVNSNDNSVFLEAFRKDNPANTGRAICLNAQGGMVGIGLSSPSETLDVAGNVKSKLSDSNSTGLTLNSSLNDNPQLSFHASDNSSRFLLNASLNGVTTNDLLKFETATKTDAFVIKGDGNIGVGTNTPRKPLTVNGSAMLQHENYIYWGDIATDSAHSYIGVSQAVNKDMHLRLNSATSDAKLVVSAGANGDPTFTADGKGRVEVGNVGNTGSVDATTVQSGDVMGIRIKNEGDGGTTTNTGGAVVFDNTGGRAIAAIAGRQNLTNKDASELAFFTHSSATDAVEQMVLDQAGKLGIGTSSPSAKLHVEGDVKIVDGTQGAGKVLTSDANGVASWQDVNSGTQISNESGTNYSLNRTITNGTKILVDASFTIDGTATGITNINVVPQNAGGKKWFKLTRLIYVLDEVTSATSTGFGTFDFPDLLNQGGNTMSFTIYGNSAGQFNYLEDTVIDQTIAVDTSTSIEYNTMALPNISSGNVSVSYTPAGANRASGTVKMILEGYLI